MGILKLNELFKSCFPEQLNKQYDFLIIDGSNILFQTLCSELSKLKKSGAIITQWQSLNIDLVSQISYIIQYAIQDISDTINKYFDRGVKEVVMVVDPVDPPSYVISSSFTFNHEYQDLIDEDLKKGVNISLQIKSEEQEKRRAAANKTDTKIDAITEIQNLSSLSQEQKNILSSIYKQSFTFNENRQLLVLGEYVLKNVHRMMKDKNFKLIRAQDEADLVIKNIGESYTNDEKILILSMDTDYNVLFGFNPNVDTCSLMNRYVIYNPYKCWKALFKESPSFDFDHIIRLAPLFGNDYTVKEFLISSINLQDAISLYESRIQELKEGSRSKKITKFAKTIISNPPEDELLDLDLLDKYIYEWNQEYFEKYYRSNIIYTNWDKYNRYEEVAIPDDCDCTMELDNALSKLFDSFRVFDQLIGGQTIDSSEPNNEHKYILYKWNANYIFNDWDKFFSTLEIQDFDCVDTFLEYYYENEYKDEAAEFLDD